MDKAMIEAGTPVRIAHQTVFLDKILHRIGNPVDFSLLLPSIFLYNLLYIYIFSHS